MQERKTGGEIVPQGKYVSSYFLWVVIKARKESKHCCYFHDVLLHTDDYWFNQTPLVIIIPVSMIKHTQFTKGASHWTQHKWIQNHTITCPCVHTQKFSHVPTITISMKLNIVRSLGPFISAHQWVWLCRPSVPLCCLERFCVRLDFRVWPSTVVIFGAYQGFVVWRFRHHLLNKFDTNTCFKRVLREKWYSVWTF